MEREDSGVIDLHAIHQKGEPQARVETPLSSPPPAFTMDTGSFNDDLDALRPKNRKKKLFIGLGAAGAALLIGLVAFGATGSKPEPVKAAAAPPAATFVVARTPPPEAAPPPPPAVVPPAPATGAAPVKAAPVRAARGGKAAPTKSSGPKLTKVQSAGT